MKGARKQVEEFAAKAAARAAKEAKAAKAKKEEKDSEKTGKPTEWKWDQVECEEGIAAADQANIGERLAGYQPGLGLTFPTP